MPPLVAALQLTSSQCYLHAYRIAPDSPLAVHALRKLYEKDENWEKLGRLFEVLVQQSYDACVPCPIMYPDADSSVATASGAQQPFKTCSSSVQPMDHKIESVSSWHVRSARLI